MVIFHKYVSLPESISYYASIKKNTKHFIPNVLWLNVLTMAQN